MKSRKHLTLKFLSAMFCLMTVVIAACGGPPASNSNTGSSDNQTLRYPVVGDIKSFDPALVEDTDSNFPIQATFTGLVTLDENLKVIPALAQSLPDISSDGLTYTFKLKPNLKFSNGDPLTSKDVVYSINRTIAKATNSDVSYYLSLVKDYDKFNAGKIPTLIGDSLIAPDPQTVKIVVSQKNAFFLEALSYPTSYVVNEKVVEKYTNPKDPWTNHEEDGAGDGPYKVVKYDHTKGITLVRNDNYYGAKPAIKNLQVAFYLDEGGMYKAFQAKQLDFTYVPTANISDEKDNPQLSSVPVLTIRYLSLNYLAKPFDNIKIRQALALALDKDAIVKTALNGAFTPTNHIIPSGMPGYYPGLTGPDGVASTKGDATKAKQLLQEGLKEEGLSQLPALTLTYYPREDSYKDAMSQIVQMWQDNLGVKVNVQVTSRPQLLSLEEATKNNTGPLKMWQAGWNADYPDPQDWLTTFFDQGSDYNQFSYGQNHSTDAAQQVAVQQELRQADVEQDATKRMQMYNDAEQKVINDVGWLPLWQEKVYYLTNANVKGLALDSEQLIPPDKWSTITIG